MNGLVNGIYDLCDTLTPVLLAVLVLELVITGLSTVLGGADSHAKFKETMKWVIIGSAIGFSATALGKTIASFFM